MATEQQPAPTGPTDPVAKSNTPFFGLGCYWRPPAEAQRAATNATAGEGRRGEAT